MADYEGINPYRSLGLALVPGQAKDLNFNVGKYLAIPTIEKCRHGQSEQLKFQKITKSLRLNVPSVIAYFLSDLCHPHASMGTSFYSNTSNFSIQGILEKKPSLSISTRP